MVFALVQWAKGATFTGTTGSAVFGSPVTAGNAILVGIAINDNTRTLVSITDGTNSYTNGTASTGAAGVENCTYGFTLGAANTTPTVVATASGGTAGLLIWIEEWSGIATSLAADGSTALFTAGSGAANEPFNAGTFTPTAGSLIWAWSLDPQSLTTKGSSFTLAKDDSGPSGYLSEFATASGSATAPNFTANTGGFSYYAVAAGFKSATAPVSIFEMATPSVYITRSIIPVAY